MNMPTGVLPYNNDANTGLFLRTDLALSMRNSAIEMTHAKQGRIYKGRKLSYNFILIMIFLIWTCTEGVADSNCFVYGVLGNDIYFSP